MEYQIQVKTNQSEDFKNITPQIEEIISSSNIKSGLVLVYVPHATAAITINENADPNIGFDILKAIKRIIPDHNNYSHDRIDNNASSHINSSLIGPSETLQIRDNQLVLGTWQSILLMDFDGPKTRNINIKIISD